MIETRAKGYLRYSVRAGTYFKTWFSATPLSLLPHFNIYCSSKHKGEAKGQNSLFSVTRFMLENVRGCFKRSTQTNRIPKRYFLSSTVAFSSLLISLSHLTWLRRALASNLDKPKNVFSWNVSKMVGYIGTICGGLWPLMTWRKLITTPV